MYNSMLCLFTFVIAMFVCYIAFEDGNLSLPGAAIIMSMVVLMLVQCWRDAEGDNYSRWKE